MTIGERVKSIRKELGLTQEEFGSRLSLVASTICLIENGSAKVTERTIKGICREFNISREWLLNGTGNRHISSHEYLTSEFENIISKYPSLYETARIVAKNMTSEDWKRINDLLTEMGG